MQEAVQHSEQLAQDFPVQMNRSYRSRPASTAGAASTPSLSSLKFEKSGVNSAADSRTKFLHLLQKLHGDEYGARTKSDLAGLLLLREEDHMQALKKQNRDISRRLSKILHQQKDRPGGAAGKTDKRIQVADFKKKFGREVTMQYGLCSR